MFQLVAEVPGGGFSTIFFTRMSERHVNRRAAPRVAGTVDREQKIVVGGAGALDEARIVPAVHHDIAPSEQECVLAGDEILRGQQRAPGSVQIPLPDRGYPGRRMRARHFGAPRLDLLREISGDNRDFPDFTVRERLHDMLDHRFARDFQQRLGGMRGQVSEAPSAPGGEQHGLSDLAGHGGEDSIAKRRL